MSTSGRPCAYCGGKVPRWVVGLGYIGLGFRPSVVGFLMGAALTVLLLAGVEAIVHGT